MSVATSTMLRTSFPNSRFSDLWRNISRPSANDQRAQTTSTSPSVSQTTGQSSTPTSSAVDDEGINCIGKLFVCPIVPIDRHILVAFNENICPALEQEIQQCAYGRTYCLQLMIAGTQKTKMRPAIVITTAERRTKKLIHSHLSRCKSLRASLKESALDLHLITSELVTFAGSSPTRTTHPAIQRPSTRRRPPAVSKPVSITKRPTSNKRPKRSSQTSNAKTPIYSYPCPFAPFGCPSKFPNKNEWKRHNTTQHLCLGFYRCDLGVCRLDHESGLTRRRGWNDFGRKDLFIQHARRMHFEEVGVEAALRASGIGEGTRVSKGYEGLSREEKRVWEEKMEGVRARCWIRRREAPMGARCAVEGCKERKKWTWEERMEHVAEHWERGERREEGVDEELLEWCVREEIVVEDGGRWVLSRLKETEDETGHDDPVFVMQKGDDDHSSTSQAEPDIDSTRKANSDVEDIDSDTEYQPTSRKSTLRPPPSRSQTAIRTSPLLNPKQSRIHKSNVTQKPESTHFTGGEPDTPNSKSLGYERYLADLGKLNAVIGHTFTAVCGIQLLMCGTTEGPPITCTVGGTWMVNGQAYSQAAFHPFDAVQSGTLLPGMSEQTDDIVSGLDDAEDTEEDDDEVLSLLADSSTSTNACPVRPGHCASTLPEVSRRAANLDQLHGQHELAHLSSQSLDLAVLMPSGHDPSVKLSRLSVLHYGLGCDWVLFSAVTDEGQPIPQVLSVNKVNGSDITDIWSDRNDSVPSDVTVDLREGEMSGLYIPGNVRFHQGGRIFDLRMVTTTCPLERGASGAWVTGNRYLFGTVLFGRPGTNWLYIMPAKPMVTEMEAVCCAPVRLPTSTDIQSQPQERSELPLVRGNPRAYDDTASKDTSVVSSTLRASSHDLAPKRKYKSSRDEGAHRYETLAMKQTRPLRAKAENSRNETASVGMVGSPRMIAPRPSQSTHSAEIAGWSTDDSVPHERKKRGRPTKGQAEERDRVLAAEGKVYEPKKRSTKTFRGSKSVPKLAFDEEAAPSSMTQSPSSQPIKVTESAATGYKRR